MALEFEGKTIETTESGHLVNADDWSEDLARHIASLEGIELTEQHWDVIKYLRDEFFNQGGNQPNERTILKALGKKWDRKISSQQMYALFPKMPSKQGGKIAGLPETRRKGGY